MEYKEVLAHLVRFHCIDEYQMGAFRARIHVLRKFNVPSVPKVGKGARATFTLDDLGELHLALSLSEFGFTPSRVRWIMRSLRDSEELWPLTKWNDEWLLITSTSFPGDIDLSAEEGTIAVGYALLESDKELTETLREVEEGPKIVRWRALLHLGLAASNLRSVMR